MSQPKPAPQAVFEIPDPEPAAPADTVPVRLSGVERTAYRRLAAMVLVLALLLFGAAGQIGWPGAWAFLAALAAASVLIIRDLAIRDPALLAERLTPLSQAGQPGWDKTLLKLLAAGFLLWLAAMGLERRYSAGWPWPVQDVGALGLIAGLALIGWTFRANSFLAPVVRMQTERDQTVVSSGPYALVRHPMYVGALLIFAFTPLLLGSLVGLAGGAVLAALLIRRTRLEDRALLEGLTGYGAYAAEVRFRLIPGLW